MERYNKCFYCGKDFLVKRPKNKKGCSIVCTNKLKSLSKKSENNPNWSGGEVGYDGVHFWIKRNYPRLTKCESCGVNKPNNRNLDLANISGEYKRERSDWEYLCRNCHMRKDGRMVNLIKRMGLRKGKKLPIETRNKMSESKKKMYRQWRISGRLK